MKKIKAEGKNVFDEKRKDIRIYNSGRKKKSN